MGFGSVSSARGWVPSVWSVVSAVVGSVSVGAVSVGSGWVEGSVSASSERIAVKEIRVSSPEMLGSVTGSVDSAGNVASVGTVGSVVMSGSVGAEGSVGCSSPS